MQFAVELERRGRAARELIAVSDRLNEKLIKIEGVPLVALEEWARETKSMRAVCMASAFGYGQQAQLVARSLFESAICMRWVFLHLDIADRYLDLHYKLTVHLHNEARKNLGLEEIEGVDEISADDLAEAQRLFGRKATNLWTGHARLGDLVSEIADSMDEGPRRYFSLTHSVAVSWVNKVIHNTGVSNRSYRDASGESAGDVATVISGPSRREVFDALLLAASSYLAALEVFIPAVDKSLEASLERTSARLWRAWKPIDVLLAMKPTDECICDTPKGTWKECHAETDKYADTQVEREALRLFRAQPK